MNNNNQIICLGWATKRLFRNKANFSVLEGLLTLLSEKITIQKLPGSESNRRTCLPEIPKMGLF